MEIGIVFWAVIIYSVVGWLVFQGITRSIFSRLAASEVIEVSSTKLFLGAILLLVGATISGPMTWGNAIRSWLVRREELSGLDK